MLVHWIIDNFDTRWGRPTSSSPLTTWNSDFTKEQKWQETTVMTLLQSQFQHDAPAVSRENSLFFAVSCVLLLFCFCVLFLSLVFCFRSCLFCFVFRVFAYFAHFDQSRVIIKTP
jgi:hypothetical protein